MINEIINYIKASTISYSKKCNMFSKTSALLLLLFINFSSQLPDCKDVTLYFCSDLKNAIASIQPGYYIGLPDTFSKGFLIENVKVLDPLVPRVMCSNYKDAWSWKKKVAGWADSIDISRIATINIHGNPFYMNFEQPEKQNVGGVKDLDKYLEMNCRFTTFDSGPRESNAFMHHWSEYNVNAIPKNAFNAGHGYHPINGYKQGPYYIGLLTYLGKTYIAKIMANVLWMNIILDNGQELSITSARKALILTNNTADEFTWERVRDFKSNLKNTGSIFKCKGIYNLMFTSNLNLCDGLKTFKLVQESDRHLFDE